jgi:nucleotide-binding universal stress UspA family protein
MRVLIGTDGSDDAIAAATKGVELLASPAEVTLVVVVEAPGAATAGLESGFAGGMVEDAEVDRAWALVEEEADEAMERTAAALGLDVPVDKVTRAGEAGPAICRLAAEIDADTIVVGSRGRGAIKRALLGSVSQHVTLNAPCPVVVVRHGLEN